jgi:cyanophycinase
MSRVARFVRATLFVFAAGPAFVAASNAQSPSDPNEPQGYAVPIGGALRYDNDEVWTRLVELAGGRGARYVVFATAASNPEKSAALIVQALQQHGAVAEHIPVAPKIKGIDIAQATRDPALIEKVRNARGVYFAGGAQERIVDTLTPGGVPTPMLDAIWSVYRRGGVVAGSSAGAAIMSTTMFRDAQDVLSTMKNGVREGKEIDRGLGFVGPSLFVDQHFLKRGRIGRMLVLMTQKKYALGLGVDENTAAVIHAGQVEVIGGKGALLVDLRDARTDATLPAFNLSDARLTYLDHGDRYDLRRMAITPSPQKLADLKVDPNAKDFSPYFKNKPYYPDILGDTTIANAMANLIDNEHSQAIGLAANPAPGPDDTRPELGFEFRLRRASDSIGWYTGTFGGEDYTVSNIRLDVTPVVLARPAYRPLRSAADKP